MRPFRYVVLGLAVLASSAATAQEAEPEDEVPPEFHCEDRDLPEELAQLCASFELGYADEMSRPAYLSGTGRPNLSPSLLRKPLQSQVKASGLSPTPALDRLKNPFDGPSDHSVGFEMRSSDAPVQFSTNMVQPGAEGDMAFNWELRAQNQTDRSGFFVGAATGGTHTQHALTENLSGFAGLRSVVSPVDNLRLSAEIAPRMGVADFAAPTTSTVLEPKLSAKSNLGQLGTSDFVGSIDANAGYSMPMEGDASAWGSFRFLVRPK